MNCSLCALGLGTTDYENYMCIHGNHGCHTCLLCIINRRNATNNFQNNNSWYCACLSIYTAEHWLQILSRQAQQFEAEITRIRALQIDPVTTAELIRITNEMQTSFVDYMEFAMNGHM